MTDQVTELAQRALHELKAAADPVRAENELKYFKGTINNLGVTLPKIQAIEKQLCKELPKTWNVDDAMRLCGVLMSMRIFETTLFASFCLDRFSDLLGEAELCRIERWLEADYCDNWAAVDTLCNHAVGTLIQQHRHLAERVKRWAYSTNRWVRRASAVTFVLTLRQGLFLDAAYEIAEVLIQDKTDDLVQKGNGWMLREAGITDPERLERFLLKQGPDIPRTTVRYAIEKFPPEKRKELLEATKGRT